MHRGGLSFLGGVLGALRHRLTTKAARGSIPRPSTDLNRGLPAAAHWSNHANTASF